MGVAFPTDTKKLREFNFIRYNGVPPSWDLIKKVIEKSKLKRQYKFERVWGIPIGTIQLYKNGFRDLPSTYWNIFYDFDIVNQKYNKKTKPVKKINTKFSTANKINDPNKHEIDEFKTRQPAG